MKPYLHAAPKCDATACRKHATTTVIFRQDLELGYAPAFYCNEHAEVVELAFDVAASGPVDRVPPSDPVRP